jgi:hypothetical protein
MDQRCAHLRQVAQDGRQRIARDAFEGREEVGELRLGILQQAQTRFQRGRHDQGGGAGAAMDARAALLA